MRIYTYLSYLFPVVATFTLAWICLAFNFENGQSRKVYLTQKSATSTASHAFQNKRNLLSQRTSFSTQSSYSSKVKNPPTNKHVKLKTPSPIKGKKKTPKPTKTNAPTAPLTIPWNVVWTGPGSWLRGTTIFAISRCTFVFSNSGQLQVTRSGVVIWASPIFPTSDTLLFSENGDLILIDVQRNALWQPVNTAKRKTPVRKTPTPTTTNVAMRLDTTCLLDVMLLPQMELLYSPFFSGISISTPSHGQTSWSMSSPNFLANGPCRLVFSDGNLIVVRQLNVTQRAILWTSPTGGLGFTMELPPDGTIRVESAPYGPNSNLTSRLWQPFPAYSPPRPVFVRFESSQTCLLLAASHATSIAGASFSTSPLLFTKSGSMLPNVTVQPIFLGPKWTNSSWVGDRITSLVKFFDALPGSVYHSTLNQYLGSNNLTIGPFTVSSLSVASTWQSNPDFYGGLGSTICSLLQNGTIRVTGSPSTYIFPTYLDVPYPNWSGICGFHYFSNCNLVQKKHGKRKGRRSKTVTIVYAGLWDFANQPGCLIPNLVSSRQQIAASLARVSAHELAEAQLSPKYTGWHTPQNFEVCDLCQALDAKTQLQDGSYWVLPALWSNALRSCSWGVNAIVSNVIPDQGVPTMSPTSPTKNG